LRQLNNALAAAGKIPPASNYTPAVRSDLWRQCCYAGQIAPAETDAAREKALQRAAKTLVANGHVGKWQNWVWPT